MKSILTLIASLLTALTVRAQISPYAGEQTREIKALSESDLNQLRAGHGMGLARAAELNGYPGPRHALDSAAELRLTAEQTAALTKIFDAMHAAALPLGETVIAKEAELDRLFTSRQADAAAVLAATREIGHLQGELRAVHLNAHVATVKILTPEQVAAYNHLRGYDAPAATTPEPTGHHPGSP